MTDFMSGQSTTGFDHSKKRRGIRLQHAQSGLYLHISGAGEVKGTLYSWIGTWDQAATLRQRSKAVGAPFPYIEVQP